MDLDGRKAIKSVAIIGAGASGLAMARRFVQDGWFENIVVYEQRPYAGGMWNLEYVGHTNFSHEFALSASYEGLHANTLNSMTRIDATKFPSSVDLFPTRAEVLAHLNNVADEIQHLIRYNCQVVEVSLRSGVVNGRWQVRTIDVREQAACETFDTVVVASGYYEEKRLPTLDGLHDWMEKDPDSIIHARDYRASDFLIGKKVLIIGYSASGIDIAGQIMYSTQSPIHASQSKCSAYFQERSRVVVHPKTINLCYEGRSARFADGSQIFAIDSIILCTGYHYSVPYLTDDFKTDVQPRMINNLYAQMFSTRDHTLVFAGVPEKTPNFLVMQCQAAVVSAVWARHIDYPAPSQFRFPTGTTDAPHILASPADLEYMDVLYEWWHQGHHRTIEQPLEPPPHLDLKERKARGDTAKMKIVFDQNRSEVGEPMPSTPA